MKWDTTLWVPGTDHAGISTQARVEKRVEQAGTNRKELWRERFIEECKKWVAEYGGNIQKQMGKVGSSVSWDHERYTFDESSNALVEDIFVDMYNKWLIYRGEYMVNYSPALDSVISDIEVEHIEVEEKMYYINYFVSGTDNELTVATTRPETLLWDLAVAVHPKDKRYKKLIGKNVILPILNKEIPIIGDEMVDMEFGTWVVKITPAHDPADFDTAKRHGIRTDFQVVDKYGYMTPDAILFVWQYGATEARNNIVELLRAKWNLVKVEPYTHKVGFCERSKCRVESVISTQWFVRASKMAEKVIAGYKKNEFEIIPNRFEKTFEDWIYNLRDWCISRQLWWGHQIPAYFDTNTGELLGVTRDPTLIYLSQCKKYSIEPNKQLILILEDSQKRSNSNEVWVPKWAVPHSTANEETENWIRRTSFSEASLKRDDDVLDTWFSSALWPFSVLDWKIDTPGDFFKKFYPADVLETGHDILFFWVIRMLLMGYEFTGETPFKTIYLHGLVLNEKGRKMSKSEGTVIDPLTIIDEYSADALRLSLIIGNTPGNNLNFSPRFVEEQSMFLNKLWNIARFVSMNIGKIEETDSELIKTLSKNKKSLLPYEKWILSRLSWLISRTTDGMEDYSFSINGGELMAFIREEFADFVIEAYKLEKTRSKYGKEVLSYVLITLLKLAHPYIPYITEALWREIQWEEDYIMLSKWPLDLWKRDHEIESEMKIVFEIVRMIRNLRAESKIKPGDEREVYIAWVAHHIVEENKWLIEGLTRTSNLYIDSKPENESKYAFGVAWWLDIYVDAQIDSAGLEEEKARLQLEIADKKEYLRSISTKLMNPSFAQNAPEKVVRAEMEKQKSTEEQLHKLEEKYKML
jgi:valyl-tRNA synthetase